MRILKALLAVLPVVVATSQDFIHGIAWFGAETEHRDLMCRWSKHPDIAWHLHKIESLGFNTVRIPFSYDYVISGDWHVLDELFQEVEKTQNLSLVLDFHRLESSHQSPKPWIEGRVDFDQFLGAWDTILARYQHSPRLSGVDIWNEYQSDNYVEWNSIARQIVSYIDTHYGHLGLIYYVQGTNWAGNIHNVDLEDMACANRIRYTIHKYWFSDTEPLEEHWNYSFGLNHLPPEKINVGEWGYISDHPTEVDWATRFMHWIKDRGIRSSFFWTWSYNSGDTGGILLPDCESIDCKKMYLLRQYWS